MGSLIIRKTKVILENEILDNADVLCTNGKITGIYSGNQRNEWLTADVSVDGSGFYLAPGFIDMHIHGVKNMKVERGSYNVEQMSSILPRYGVTGFVPTVCPLGSCDEDSAFLQELVSTAAPGTEILGFLLEGHFLSLTGAINKVGGDIDPVKKAKMLLAAAGGKRLIFAISPEFKGILDVLSIIKQTGNLAFITHTAATVEQTLAAIDAGAQHATHFYNVFPYGKNGESGVRRCSAAEAVLSRKDCSVDIILDGEHTNPIIVKVALAAKDEDSVSLISDANLTAGLPPGRYKGISNLFVEVDYAGGPARIAEGPKKGRFAGSGLTMDLAVRNAIKMLDLSLPLAVKMASLNPARVLKIENQKGRVAEGYDADLVLLDQNLEVAACWVGGELKYKADELG